MASRSCGTCRDRRILCDRTTPTCVHCSESNRACKGYGLRLSWPKANDGRRAVVGKPAVCRSKIRRLSDNPQVDASSWDIEMHHRLSTAITKEYMQPALGILISWNPFKLEVGENELFQYFQSTVSRSLTTLGHDPTDVGNVLIRMALPSNTPSAAAVFRALLALSSLHRYGLQSQAADLKISAIAALAAASKSNIGPKEAIQHVAAGMLLCSFEIQEVSCISSDWTWYLRGVKSVIKAASLNDFAKDSDFATLLNWVYYHDVLARFSLCYWRRQTKTIQWPRASLCAQNNETSSTFSTLEMLSTVCETVSTRPAYTMSGEGLNDYKGFLKILDWKIRNNPPLPTSSNSPESIMLAELFQLATLVYLDRASGNLLDQEARTQERISKAFTILSQLPTCERQFPLFLLGCEARTDEQRVTIFDLISNTEKNTSSRSFMYTKRLLQAIWVQDDLATQQIDYTNKLSAMISCCSTLPTFV